MMSFTMPWLLGSGINIKQIAVRNYGNMGTNICPNEPEIKKYQIGYSGKAWKLSQYDNLFQTRKGAKHFQFQVWIA